MVSRKEVFISATSADLGSYRQVVKEALLTRGAHPVEQKNFPTEYSELQGLLARVLDHCDAVIHLVGFYYGGEPNPTPDIPRRSWAQWEYYRASEGAQPKPVYLFLARENCAFDARPSENAEKQRLQREHRERLKTGGSIYYQFSTPEELRGLVLSIDDLRKLLSPRLVRIPFLPMREEFTGRRGMLQTLEKELTTGDASVLSQPIAIHAGGGVGKTALAAELGWRLFEARKFDFVLFLNASTPETLNTELAALCAGDALDLPEQRSQEQNARLRGVMRWLHAPGNAPRTLLIFDNADSEDARKAVRELLPQLAGCAVLITSRHSVWSGVHDHELALFTPEESREYLHTHLEPELLAKPGAEAALDKLAEEVGNLPLALELMVSYVHETNQSPSEWLEEWLKKAAPKFTDHDDVAVSYPVPLIRVWEQSFARLSPTASDLLCLLAWLAPWPAALPLEPLRQAKEWPASRAAFRELAKDEY
jgi:hypothetical protein